jgi:hypothetical protein
MISRPASGKPTTVSVVWCDFILVASPIRRRTWGLMDEGSWKGSGVPVSGLLDMASLGGHTK